GVVSAELAAQGFQGPPRPIEGLRGFLSVFGGNRDEPALTGGLGKRWEMTQVAYKPYPSGVVLHALIESVLEHRGKIRDAQKIEVRLSPLAVERTDRPEPRNAIEARLSAQHAVAVALARGQAGLSEFSDAAALDPAIQALRRRVQVIADQKLDNMAAVVVAGTARIEAPASRPMDDARLEAKFRELAGSRAETWLAFIRSLDTLEAVSLP
ncbi:MAG TPA: MmgE/PrpD family protein, partial [Burkholderiales bacterium]|nr:MmgE/PrpD family protein [Burkholderiales bacterium]